MASEIVVASVGLMWWRSGIGEWPEVEVSMHVFIIVASSSISTCLLKEFWFVYYDTRYHKYARVGTYHIRTP